MSELAGKTKFQGKTEALGSSFFPTNFFAPITSLNKSSPLSCGWLPPPLQDVSNTHRDIDEKEIAAILKSCNVDAVVGANTIFDRMMNATNTACTNHLPTIFSQLIKHGTFTDSWKIVKFLPISKPGRANM